MILRPICSINHAPSPCTHYYRYHPRRHRRWDCSEKGKPTPPITLLLDPFVQNCDGADAHFQFVYDPHVAPYIEAFLAAHTTPSRRHTPIPVPLHSTSTSARSSSRRDRTSELRQRRYSTDEQELREPLLRSERYTEDAMTGDGKVERSFELQEAERVEYPVIPPSTSKSSPFVQSAPPRHTPSPVPTQPPISALPVRKVSVNEERYREYARPSTPQENEIRQVFFDLPPLPTTSIPAFTPSQSGPSRSSTPRSAITRSPEHGLLSLGLPGQSLGALNAHSINTGNNAQLVPPESTTFSFLSLSQASSPEAPHAMLASMTFSDAADQWADVRRESSADRAGREGRGEEYDVMSLPETTMSGMSGYEDAEVYSPGSVRSPISIHTQLETSMLGQREEVPGGMRNLSGLQDGAGLGGIRRGPMSVVSLSESEGWGGESDWEGKSEAGPR